ncbi:MAG: DUF2796 domain-containing protein [Pseudomonadota bacterium]|nr:DUF2796 domain-containing protein [Pseudomonadota bacterium]
MPYYNFFQQGSAKCLLAVVACLSVSQVLAYEAAHVHGEATLMVAIEGDALEMQLVLPALDVLGFAHGGLSSQAASTASTLTKNELTQVELAQQKLRDTAALFDFESGGCALVDSSVDFSAVLEPGAEHGHSEHEHSDHHSTQHAEVQAGYRFSCQSTKSIELEVNVFSVFPSVEKVQAVYVLDHAQGSVSLSSERRQLIMGE